MDEPLADASILPTVLLCRFAREAVTVALGGDGGDELFAGYDPVVALWPARAYDSVTPLPLHTALLKLAAALPASSSNMPLSFRIQRFLRAAKVRRGLRLPTWMGPFDPSQLARLMRDGTVVEEPFAAEEQLYARVLDAGGDDVRAALAYFQRFYLTDDILVKVDRASMMSSLEVRAPFLDTELAEFVNRLPSSFKMRFGARKRLLKRAFGSAAGRAALPVEILRRPKKGFGIPVAQWIRHELRAEFRRSLVDAWPGALEVIDRREIRRLLDAHVAGRENNYKELWALFMLAEWARRWAA
jgi:asparagine synthase (glutamine-hydrolysing)